PSWRCACRGATAARAAGGLGGAASRAARTPAARARAARSHPPPGGRPVRASLAGSRTALELLDRVDRPPPHVLVDRTVAEAAALEERRQPVHRGHAVMPVKRDAAEVLHRRLVGAA